MHQFFDLLGRMFSGDSKKDLIDSKRENIALLEASMSLDQLCLEYMLEPSDDIENSILSILKANPKLHPYDIYGCRFEIVDNNREHGLKFTDFMQKTLDNP